MFQPVQVLAPKILAAAMASFFASYGVPGPRCFVVRLFGARAHREEEKAWRVVFAQDLRPR